MFYWLTFVQMKFCDVKLLENQKTEKKKREREREMWLRPNFLGEKRVRKNPQRLPAGHLHLMNHGEDPAQRLSKARALPQPHSAIQRSVLHVDAIHRLVEPLHAQSIRSALSETLSASVESRWICSVDSLPFLPTKTCGYTSNECMFLRSVIHLLILILTEKTPMHQELSLLKRPMPNVRGDEFSALRDFDEARASSIPSRLAVPALPTTKGHRNLRAFALLSRWRCFAVTAGLGRFFTES